jgi:hypothetical protein
MEDWLSILLSFDGQLIFPSCEVKTVPQQAIKGYMGSRGTAPLILNLAIKSKL